MQKPLNNYAFIDGNNLNLGIKGLGWKLDYRRFRTFLTEKHGVKNAYIFMGYSPTQQNLYKSLQEQGYIMIFKPTMILKDGAVKGNCDAELVLNSMVELPNYDKAILVTGDGDFYCLAEYLIKVQKFERILAPSQKSCSYLLRKVAGSHIIYISDLRTKLEYKNHT